MRSTIHNLRKQAAALRVTLLSPLGQGLASHLPVLQEAVLTLQRLQTSDTMIEPGSRRELQALARDWDAVGRLIAAGLAFQQGWARLLASANSGYRPDGEPISLETTGSISVQG